MSSSISSQVKYPAFRDLTPAGQTAHLWFRQVARALKTCRLYRQDSPIVVQVRSKLMEPLLRGIESHGVWSFRITPSEIFLLDEAVVRLSLIHI